MLTADNTCSNPSVNKAGDKTSRKSALISKNLNLNDMVRWLHISPVIYPELNPILISPQFSRPVLWFSSPEISAAFSRYHCIFVLFCFHRQALKNCTCTLLCFSRIQGIYNFYTALPLLPSHYEWSNTVCI